MTKKNQYLLLQSIENSNNYTFESTLEMALKKRINAENLLVLDNFSDGISMSHASKFIKDAEVLVIVVDEAKGDSNGLISKILNQTVRKPNTTLFCINPIRQILPFLKMLKGEQFNDESALIKRVLS
ncbi:MAG: hypothetical protein RIA69_00690 [Cyclobacteriaceae bacterium]